MTHLSWRGVSASLKSAGVLLAIFVSVAASNPAEAAPRDWSEIVRAFETVFTPHPGCVGSKLSLSDMDCSNFRGRALKRFQHEWEANSFWSEGRFVENEQARRRVNSELPK